MSTFTYDKYIQNILITRGRFNCDGYCERHHIKPRCLGGKNTKENLIDLYAREHFIAHKLLAHENPNNSQLVYAFWMMAHIGRVEVTPEEYEEARIACSKIMSRDRKGWYLGEANPNFGNKWSDEQKQHMSEVKSNISSETRKKQSIAQKRRMSDPHNNPMYGKTHSAEAKAKIAAASKSRSPEVIKKLSDRARERLRDPRNRPRSIPVVCLSLSETVLDVFVSASDASNATGVSRSQISCCCHGLVANPKPFRWKFLYDQGDGCPGAVSLGLIDASQAEILLQNRYKKITNKNNDI